MINESRSDTTETMCVPNAHVVLNLVNNEETKMDEYWSTTSGLKTSSKDHYQHHQMKPQLHCSLRSRSRDSFSEISPKRHLISARPNRTQESGYILSQSGQTKRIFNRTKVSCQAKQKWFYNRRTDSNEINFILIAIVLMFVVHFIAPTVFAQRFILGKSTLFTLTLTLIIEMLLK